MFQTKEGETTQVPCPGPIAQNNVANTGTVDVGDIAERKEESQEGDSACGTGNTYEQYSGVGGFSGGHNERGRRFTRKRVLEEQCMGCPSLAAVELYCAARDRQEELSSFRKCDDAKEEVELLGDRCYNLKCAVSRLLELAEAELGVFRHIVRFMKI